MVKETRFTPVAASVSPPPNTYSIPSEFDKHKKKGKVFSFRCSWKAYDKVYQKEGFKNTIPVDPNLPGPGAYKSFTSIGKEARNITLKGKFANLKGNTNVPGPGAYREYTSMPRTGRNFHSRFKSV